MEKLIATPKMSKIDLNKMCFKILLSMKGDKFRARSEILSQIPNIANKRPEATSTKSYSDAVQKLIPKIKDSLKNTDKKLGEIYQDENGNIVFCVHNIVYTEHDTTNYYNSNNISIDISSISNIFSSTKEVSSPFAISSSSLSKRLLYSICKSETSSLITAKPLLFKLSINPK